MLEIYVCPIDKYFYYNYMLMYLCLYNTTDATMMFILGSSIRVLPYFDLYHGTECLL